MQMMLRVIFMGQVESSQPNARWPSQREVKGDATEVKGRKSKGTAKSKGTHTFSE